ncbi:hypothetical protein DNTS_002485 [Danionella cerebrum]|uniref:Uncharacterized protein n=1 Tax=Danionella cerebrum TaxID=2873325 RepID=A0A553PXI8_9TELE|nr:hypothetical protein DNTS_002485 [Danionella translucida]
MVFKTADVGKEAVLGFVKKRLIMEMQNLQEALKVEIQIHQKLVGQMKQDPQNADLKLQLRDLQAKITALSEQQRKVVEQLRRDLLVKQEDMKLQTLQADGHPSALLITQTQTHMPAASLTTPQTTMAPGIASKTLPLVLRAATPTSPIIMTPAPTITVVTALGSTLLASPPSSDPQTSPVNFQPLIQPANHGAEPLRVLSNTTLVVRPKPPTSLSPAASQVSVQTLQSPVLLSTAIPSSGHVQQMRILNGLPTPSSTNNTSILITPSTCTQQLPHNSPSSDNMIPAVEYGTEPKTSLLISPNTPTHTSSAPSSPASTNTHTPSSKHQESPVKMAFMLSLGLVTHDYLEEIQSRRQERKRRATANPIYSGALYEPERKKSSVSYLSSINQASRKSGCLSKNGSFVEWGPLPPTTSSHHSASSEPQRPTVGSPFSPALSLTPPSHSPSPSPSPAGDILQKEDAIEWPGTKEGEKDRLKNWSSELHQEIETLEQTVGQLDNSITKCIESNKRVTAQQRKMESSLEKIRGLLHFIRGFHQFGLANGEMSHFGASKANSFNGLTTDTNNNTNTTTASSSEGLVNTSGTLNQISKSTDAASSNSDAGSEEITQVNSLSRIKSELTNMHPTAFSNNSSNQVVLCANGTMSAGEDITKKHKNTSEISVIPQALLGPIVPLTEVREGVK